MFIPLSDNCKAVGRSSSLPGGPGQAMFGAETPWWDP
jgi:hypothetical protein